MVWKIIKRSIPKLKRIDYFSILLMTLLSSSCANGQRSETEKQEILKMVKEGKYEQATFGEGCFWCVEAVFQNLKGVEAVMPGYAGGHVKNPTYKEVCTGTTGHAEVAQITFDPSVISYEELLTVFWYTHDPTTLNRQGADVGTQYRSVIFYHNENQKKAAEQSKEQTEASGLWDGPIVTAIEPLDTFYEAENYHQNYFNNNPNQPYCSVVIRPKLEKFRKEFKDKLKEQ